jgi:3-oxoacyl-[acyl-carrier-protein] synthase II
MKIYIRSTGNISPQHSLNKDIFFQTRIYNTGDSLKALEPNYDEFVDSKMIRRMSRIVKMGVASAMTCLRNSGSANPGAILTATAYGCLEDTSSFLRRMIEFEEKMLSPTAFIQSTHNTVGAQIALLLKCHNYNNTIVHRAFSFENALIESAFLLEEGTKPVLIGAVDEITDDSLAILRRFGLYKKTNGQVANFAGEGAAFFLLDREAGVSSKSAILDVETVYNSGKQETVSQSAANFLNKNNLGPLDLDLVLTSHAGMKKPDPASDYLSASVFRDIPHFPFKLLSGDYPTASGFALWLADLLMSEQKSPGWMTGLKFPLKNILIYNQHGGANHSFILITAV